MVETFSPLCSLDSERKQDHDGSERPWMLTKKRAELPTVVKSWMNESSEPGRVSHRLKTASVD